MLLMERVKFGTLALCAGLLILVVVPKLEGQVLPPIAPRPLCTSQFALASYACSLIPFTPLPPQPPPSPPSPPDLQSHGHRHRHGHHRHRHGQHGTPAQENCCRWLKQLDSQCVCDLLVRLPNFLSRPAHQYSVIVGDVCDVTFSCGGRAIRI